MSLSCQSLNMLSTPLKDYRGSRPLQPPSLSTPSLSSRSKKNAAYIRGGGRNTLDDSLQRGRLPPKRLSRSPPRASSLKNRDEESIKVVVRLKPLSTENFDSSDTQSARTWKVHGGNSITLEQPSTGSDEILTAQQKRRQTFGGTPTVYSFDRVFGEQTENQQIYDEVVKDIVHSVTERGINGTVFSYGQTSSGKTFTMLGKNGLDGGVVHLAAKDIFSRISKEANVERNFAVRASFLELYNEEVRDLLASSNGSGNSTLAVREDINRGVFVEGLTETAVSDFQSLMRVLKLGEKHKSVAATAMNDRSSRSHIIFRISVERRVTQSVRLTDAEDDKENAGNGSREASFSDSVTLLSTLNLVDLAGSESVRLTGATGMRKKEGGKINQSLLTLSRVIMGLGKPSASHINYRDSKLTRILQSSLSGNARMAVICCASTSERFVEETRSTLQFGSRAKLVKTRAKVNEVCHEDPSVIKKLQREIIKQSKEGKEALRQLRELEQTAEDAKAEAEKAERKLQKLKRIVMEGEALQCPSTRKRGRDGSKLSKSRRQTMDAIAAAPRKCFADEISFSPEMGSADLFVSCNDLRRNRQRRNSDGAISFHLTKNGASLHSSAELPTNHLLSPTSNFADAPLLREALAFKSKQISALKEKLNCNDEATITLQTSWERDKDELEHVVSDLYKKLDDLVCEKDQMENRIQLVSQMNDALSEENESLSQSLEDGKNDTIKLKELVEELTSEKNDALDWVEDLYSKLDASDANVKKICDEKDAVRIENEKLREELQGARNSTSVASCMDVERVVEREQQIRAENGKEQSLTKQFDTDVQTAQSTIEALRQERECLASKIQTLQAQLAKCEEDTSTFATASDEEKKQLVSENKFLTERIEQVETESADLTLALQDAESTAGELRRERECLESKIQTLQAQLSNCREDMSTFATASDEEKEQLMSENKFLTERIEQVETESADLTLALEDAKSTAGDRRQERECLESKIQTLQAQLTKCEEDVSTFATASDEEKEQLMTENKFLTERIEQVETESADLTLALQDAESTAGELRQERERLESELQTLQAQLAKCKEDMSTFVTAGHEEKERLMSENKFLTKRIEQLEIDSAHLNAVDERNKTLSLALRSAEANVSDATRKSSVEKDRLCATISRLKMEKEEVQESHYALMGEIDEFKSAVSSARAHAEAEKQELCNAIKVLEREKESSTPTSQIQITNTETDQLSRKIVMQSTEIERLTSSLEECRSRALKTEKENNRLRMQIEGTIREKEKAKHKEEAEAKAIDFGAKVAKEQALREKARAISERDHAREELQRFRAHFNQMQTEWSAEKQRNDARHSELMLSKRTYEILSADHLRLKDKLVEVCEQKNNMEVRVKGLLHSIQAAESLRVALAKERDDVVREKMNVKGAYERKIARLEKELQTLQSRVEQLSMTNDSLGHQVELIEAGKTSAESLSERRLEQENRVVAQLETLEAEYSKAISTIEALSKENDDARQKVVELEQARESPDSHHAPIVDSAEKYGEKQRETGDGAERLTRRRWLWSRRLSMKKMLCSLG